MAISPQRLIRPTYITRICYYLLTKWLRNELNVVTLTEEEVGSGEDECGRRDALATTMTTVLHHQHHTSYHSAAAAGVT